MRRKEDLSALFFRVICLGFSAILLVLALFCRIGLVRAQSRIAELEEAVRRERNTGVILRAKTAEALSLQELERRAVQELGMQHPEPDQILSVDYAG